MNQGFDLSIDINEFDFTKAAINKIAENKWVKSQWPVVYFIQNEKIGYVGESTNALSRIGNHLDNGKRFGLNKISIIGSDKFNKSATLDVESHLIQYISAEESFLLQNGNNGLTRHNYYQRDLYKDLFKEVWKKLIDKKVVSKSLEEIENSALFKYSPYKSLNQDQYNSVLDIIENLNKEIAAPIFVKGSAGTGKTILATYLIKLLTSEPDVDTEEDVDEESAREIALLDKFRRRFPNGKPEIGLVISMTSLKETLQNVFDKIPGLRSSMVISPSDTFKRKYDILIIDEAHRLRQRRNISWMGAFTKNNSKLRLGNEGNELDWVRANSAKQIFFYDAAQSIKPSDVPSEKFRTLLKNKDTVTLELKSQMRVSAGSDYISFVDKLLNCRLTVEDRGFKPKKYELLIFDSFRDLYQMLGKRENALKLCRLIAGYAWPWISKEKKNQYDIEIEGLKFFWNRTDKDWINSPSSFKEIGCIHTTQGYDLNYAGIVFGSEIKYNPETKKIEIIRQNYYDRYGMAGIRDLNELREYIINIYKTMMYRGIKGTYIYAIDKNLREYLKEHVQVYKKELPFRILPIEEVDPYVNSVPLYDIIAAAGNFSEPQNISDLKWIEPTEIHKAKKDSFVCKVVGESMSKKIPNGSWCLFKMDPGGSREGKIVLVQHAKIQDEGYGLGFTIKAYHSEKRISEEGWSHETIILRPMSNDPAYKEIVLNEDETRSLKVVGIFDSILKSD